MVTHNIMRYCYYSFPIDPIEVLLQFRLSDTWKAKPPALAALGALVMLLDYQRT